MNRLVKLKDLSKKGGLKAYDHYAALIPKYQKTLKNIVVEPFSVTWP